MSRKSQPSPVYVFVVLSLAAFLTLFTICRKPGITYETEAIVRLKQAEGHAINASQLLAIQNEHSAKYLEPSFVLDALRDADILRAENSPESLGIASDIAQRMRVRSVSRDGQAYVRLSLITEHPRAGINLLNSMAKGIVGSQFTEDQANAFPATIARQRGGSISAQSLILLCIASSVVGVFGLVLCDRAKNSPILLTPEQVEQVTDRPVIGDFYNGSGTEAAEESQRTRQRAFRIALRVAELGVAAVFVLMVYQLASKDALLDRFLVDPLAAYGEVLTHVIG